ncbi:hypothetical protein M436DRAFT_75811 [Aureobasidium namibiae CBS 147.97]|uniref:Zn(2)-C6 fungal-type domain-containing protein n=1 Tax=Aureobasidium namibiae CBS 147.97 TaxID=1043004 RepID=A0A074W9V4_9PEZI|nr:uncharacterized protein M436DRAFT_75811 [Aureobasidium namibiae CBS 147.97]KEQ69653.1 hypothetical protein M436DRAFT_75811 [Aureobasidium namibiae CBS 147.97]
MSHFSQIACEVCRTKKRKIPTCSQCVHASQTCTYPGTNKRGLPSGYLANIEERLAQTENALLQALSIIHGSESRQDSSQPHPEVSLARTERPRELEFNEVRIARVEEWQNFPLETLEQQQHWMHNRLAPNGAPTASDSIERQRETLNMTSEAGKRQRNQDKTSARKRQRSVSGLRNTPDLKAGHRFQSTTPTESDMLSTYLGTAASSPQRQQANVTCPALHLTSSIPQTRVSEHPGPGSENPPEQSKAKKLATLHSRKYF